MHLMCENIISMEDYLIVHLYTWVKFHSCNVKIIHNFGFFGWATLFFTHQTDFCARFFSGFAVHFTWSFVISRIIWGNLQLVIKHRKQSDYYILWLYWRKGEVSSFFCTFVLLSTYLHVYFLGDLKMTHHAFCSYYWFEMTPLSATYVHN